MQNVLEKELAFFEAHRAELLERGEGKYSVIKEDAVLGLYDTAENAFKAGFAEFGNKPFLIKQILAEDFIHSIPAHYLGLTNVII